MGEKVNSAPLYITYWTKQITTQKRSLSPVEADFLYIHNPEEFLHILACKDCIRTKDLSEVLATCCKLIENDFASDMGKKEVLDEQSDEKQKKIIQS